MLLLRKKEFHRIFLSALNCRHTSTAWMSFFYGSQIDISKYANNDFEFNLLKKLCKPESIFSKEERSALMFYASIKRLTLLKKSKQISTPSYYILQNLNSLKTIKEYFKQIYHHPMYKAKTSGLIKEEFVICETIPLISKSSLINLKSFFLSDYFSGFDEISARCLMLVKRYRDQFNAEKINKDSFLANSVDSEPSFKCLKECNLDELGELFSYLDKELIILCLDHLNQDNLIKTANGHIIIEKNLIENYSASASGESLDFRKQIADLHVALSNRENMLFRCDDKDVYKLFKRACHDKI